MADEIEVSYTSGFTLIAKATHDVTGTETEISLTDDTGDSYTGDFTTDMELGLYVVQIYRVAGSQELFLGDSIIVWDGERKGLSRVVQKQLAGDNITWADVKGWR